MNKNSLKGIKITIIILVNRIFTINTINTIKKTTRIKFHEDYSPFLPMMKRIETFIFWECENVCCLCTLGPRDAWLQLRKVLVNNLSLENLTCLMNKQFDFCCDYFSLQQLKYMLDTATKEQCQRLKHRKNKSNLVQKNQEDLAKDPILLTSLSC